MLFEERVDLDDCHNDDTLWGLAVQLALQLAEGSVRQKDHVLHRLIRIGIHNWTGFDVQGLEGI